MAVSTLGVAAACLLASMVPGSAAPLPVKAKIATVETTRASTPVEPSTTGSAAKEQADDAGCFTARKKLWVDGEGWIVRRVTTCR